MTYYDDGFPACFTEEMICQALLEEEEDCLICSKCENYCTWYDYDLYRIVSGCTFWNDMSSEVWEQCTRVKCPHFVPIEP